MRERVQQVSWLIKEQQGASPGEALFTRGKEGKKSNERGAERSGCWRFVDHDKGSFCGCCPKHEFSHWPSYALES
jgi:hypothetical protein